MDSEDLLTDFKNSLQKVHPLLAFYTEAIQHLMEDETQSGDIKWDRLPHVTKILSKNNTKLEDVLETAEYLFLQFDALYEKMCKQNSLSRSDFRPPNYSDILKKVEILSRDL